MTPRAAPSTADAIVGSRFELLRRLYLSELEWLSSGLPIGVLVLARAVAAAHARAKLFLAASDPELARWIELHGQQIAGTAWNDRTQLMELARAATDTAQFRRAAQLWGWILLSSRRPDEAFFQATLSLNELARGHYASVLDDTGPGSPTMLD